MRSKFHLVLFATLALSNNCFAHSFGEPYKLPMPYWMYIYGAMAALILSFWCWGFSTAQNTQIEPPDKLQLTAPV